MNVQKSFYHSPIGLLQIVFDPHHDIINTSKWIEDVHLPEGKPLPLKIKRWLDSYFSGTSTLSPQLKLEALSPLQKRVYEALQEKVPYGKVISYQNLSILIGNPNGARSIGYWMSQNPFLLFVPCHRVVSTSRKLGGFMGGHTKGLQIKTELLKREGVDINGKGLIHPSCFIHP